MTEVLSILHALTIRLYNPCQAGPTQLRGKEN
jgi:hypothetical protein